MTFIACNKTEPIIEPVRTFNYSYLSDIDGNQYKALKIGSQTWMVENLRVTHLNDGTSLKKITVDSIWEINTSPAYCWYQNDSAKYSNLYGAYYNGFTIESKLLSPKGWHIPSDSEWTVLENYLIANGYNYNGLTYGNNFAKSMASTSLWVFSEGEGVAGNTDYPLNRDASGFSAFPAGYKYMTWSHHNSSLFFCSNGIEAYWWSSTKSSRQYFAYGRYMCHNLSSLERLDFFYYNGIAVRCVKD